MDFSFEKNFAASRRFYSLKNVRRFAAIFPCKKCFFNCCDRNITQSCTNDRNNTQSARSAKILAFSTLFFEICYYFRHRFVLQHSSNACTIIQLGQKTPPILGKVHIFLGKIPGFFLGAPRIPGKIQVNTWKNKHWCQYVRFRCCSTRFCGVKII